jgi:hypothetical protein
MTMIIMIVGHRAFDRIAKKLIREHLDLDLAASERSFILKTAVSAFLIEENHALSGS